MPEKITTIEELAIMIQRTMASKEDAQELREDMNKQFAEVHEEFKRVDKRFDKLESISIPFFWLLTAQRGCV